MSESKGAPFSPPLGVGRLFKSGKPGKALNTSPEEVIGMEQSMVCQNVFLPTSLVGRLLASLFGFYYFW